MQARAIASRSGTQRYAKGKWGWQKAKARTGKFRERLISTRPKILEQRLPPPGAPNGVEQCEIDWHS
jgi:hypothetical protein